MEYMLKRWTAFTRFLDDGRICRSNNAAERGVRGVASGRKSWLFRGSDRGGERAAVMYSLIVSAEMNNVDPQAWLADVFPSRLACPLPAAAELSPCLAQDQNQMTRLRRVDHVLLAMPAGRENDARAFYARRLRVQSTPGGRPTQGLSSRLLLICAAAAKRPSASTSGIRRRKYRARR
jgi:hypothetical protein